MIRPWSYGPATQKVLEKYIRLRAALRPYIQELDHNVTTRGVPTVRPLWWEFPDDPGAIGVTTQAIQKIYDRTLGSEMGCL